jgi:tRNA/rRNA methyltransferase
MPGAGTDKTKRWIETPAPVVVLVEPQLGENIGAAAQWPISDCHACGW